MKTFRRYAVAVFAVLTAVVGLAWFFSSGEHFVRISLICYGFLLGYIAAWLHIGRRQGFRKFSRFLGGDSGD